jgi:hypothetical protein
VFGVLLPRLAPDRWANTTVGAIHKATVISVIAV